VDKLFSYTKFMVKEDHRVVRWCPKKMYERYSAVETIAFEIRKSVQHKTRVKFGRDDIELSTRDPNTTVWRKQPLPSNLPKIDLDRTSSHAPTSTPPPGRPGRNEMLAEAIEGVVAHRRVVEEAEAAKARKRQFSDSDSDSEGAKKARGEIQQDNQQTKQVDMQVGEQPDGQAGGKGGVHGGCTG
jgi:hypothetical protein